MRPSRLVPWIVAGLLAACAGPRPAPTPAPTEQAPALGEAAARLGPAQWAARARAALERGEYGRAIEAAQRARTLDPDLAEAWRLEARAREATGDLAGAREAWAGVVDRLPGDAGAVEAYARLSARLGREAESWQGLADRGAVAAGWAGWLALRAGRVDEASRLLETAVGAEEGDRWWVPLGRARLLRGDLAGAAEAAQAAVERWPRDPEAWGLRGDVAREQGLGAEARSAYEEALRLDPGRYAARVNLAVVLLGQGEAAEAEAVLREAIEKEPERPEAWNDLGLALRSQGRYAEAAEAYRKALEVRPGYLPALKNLGICYEKYLGRLADAIQVYDRYLELSPDDRDVARWRKAAKRRAGER
ncbi:tetratricopeptide repeat protein [Deferrisoma camini]|uniref:tetratricopeptide repeat protein n=1 Tax=Deferrisoma camini TaxID=1035120 RepID=UPI00046C93AA|nr:tetratricopeptide repeat protein [Deferrisoma camini]